MFTSCNLLILSDSIFEKPTFHTACREEIMNLSQIETPEKGIVSSSKRKLPRESYPHPEGWGITPSRKTGNFLN